MTQRVLASVALSLIILGLAACRMSVPPGQGQAQQQKADPYNSGDDGGSDNGGGGGGGGGY